MNPRVQQKIAEIKKLASNQKVDRDNHHISKFDSSDGLSMAIHSKKDADEFMAEIEAIVSKSK